MTFELKDNNGQLLTMTSDIRNRWREYSEELSDKKVKPAMCDLWIEEEDKVLESDKGSTLLQSEVLDAIKHLKK